MPVRAKFLLAFAMTALWLWLVANEAEGQHLPVEAPHPETGQMGVWTPPWLVREHLQDELELGVCRADRALLEKEKAQLKLKIHELEQAGKQHERALKHADRALNVPPPPTDGDTEGAAPLAVGIILALAFVVSSVVF